MNRFFLLAVLAVLSTAASANAQVIFDESTGVEGSGDPTAPTSLGSLTAGVFTVSGSSVVGANGTSSGLVSDTTRDLFGLSIASGFQLDSVVLSGLTQTANTSGNLDPGFFFVSSGTTTGIPGGAGFSPLTGSLVGVGPQIALADSTADETPIGTDLLSVTSIAGPGVTGPLAAGDYVFGIQQTGPEELSYSVTFNVSAAAIPEPSSAALISLVAFGFAGLRRRRI